jgi:hypothetical protein
VRAVGYGESCSLTTNLLSLQGRGTHSVKVIYASAQPSSLRDAAALLNQVLVEEVHRIALTDNYSRLEESHSQYMVHVPQLASRHSVSSWSVPVGRDSVVRIATRYGLDGPGIKYRLGQDFSQPSRPALRPTQLPVQWVPGLFPEGKAVGAWS